MPAADLAGGCVSSWRQNPVRADKVARVAVWVSLKVVLMLGLGMVVLVVLRVLGVVAHEAAVIRPG